MSYSPFFTRDWPKVIFLIQSCLWELQRNLENQCKPEHIYHMGFPSVTYESGAGSSGSSLLALPVKLI